eukprot:scaffold8376_cov59-Attheya_sp.AAC.2
MGKSDGEVVHKSAHHSREVCTDSTGRNADRSCTIVIGVVLRKLKIMDEKPASMGLSRRRFELSKGSGGESNKQKLHNSRWSGTSPSVGTSFAGN